MQANYAERLAETRRLLQDAEYIVIGGGAGLSSAAGLTYAGERFSENFADFIKKYSMTDMYTASFYPFDTQEEKWAYWSRHIFLNRYAPPALPLYRKLYELVRRNEHFVLTTNVDYQFHKAGFAPERIFAVQGDYGKIQCAKGCHDKLYDNEELVRRMVNEQQNCRVPSELVPKCPVCGGEMEVNVRKDEYFVQDAAWYDANMRYGAFMEKIRGKKTLLLELGVGYNTPTIIRFPFERLTYREKDVHLVRLNRDYPDGAPENRKKTITFSENMAKVLSEL